MVRWADRLKSNNKLIHTIMIFGPWARRAPGTIWSADLTAGHHVSLSRASKKYIRVASKNRFWGHWTLCIFLDRCLDSKNVEFDKK